MELISREQACDALEDAEDAFGYLTRDWREVLMELPSIQPELGTNLASLGTDCISRQSAIDAMAELQGRASSKGELTGISKAWKRIKQLPPIQPKRGRWHYSDGKPATIGKSFGVICDQCGTESEYCTNFCGECGADMREVER